MTASWEIHKEYKRGDIVYIFDTTCTCYYMCTSNHVSKTNYYPTNNKNWLMIQQEFVDEMIQYGINIGSWSLPPSADNVNPFKTCENPFQTYENPFTNYSENNNDFKAPVFDFKAPVINNEYEDSITLETSGMKRKLDKIEMEIEKYNIKKKPKTTLSKREQILLLKADVDVKSHLLERYNEIKKEAKSDYEKSMKWLTDVLKLPFNNRLEYDINLKKIQETLDQEVYGHQEIKRNILQYFAKKITNPNSKGEILALCGSPGVGKTKLVRDGLAKAIDVPFFQINCGGLNDVVVITGHSSTYVGSKPGKIVDILMQSKCNNPIIYIDELDKIAEDKRKELFGIFTHIFDEQQNSSFQDNYIGNIDIDLSKVLFVVSFNDMKSIDPILLDRFKIIQVPNPSFDDKVEICKKMMQSIQNEIWENCNLKIYNEQEFFEYLIYNYNSTDVGVRQIKKSLYTILENINLDNQLAEICSKVTKLEISHINKYLKRNIESKDYLNMYI